MPNSYGNLDASLRVLLENYDWHVDFADTGVSDVHAVSNHLMRVFTDILSNSSKPREGVLLPRNSDRLPDNLILLPIKPRTTSL